VTDAYRPRATLSDGGRFWGELQRSVARAVVEADEPLRLLAMALLADGHALIEDVPGVGKTLLAHAFARSLGLDFGRVQGTPDLLPGEITGSSVFQDGAFRFIPGPVFTNVLLVDEINRATPRTQSALLEAMQERQVTVDGESRPLPHPFLVLATENPVELEGTFSLAEAQLDRFLVRVSIGYPSEDGELAIASRYREAVEPLDAIEPIVDAARIAQLRDEVRTILVSDSVARYLVALVRATRSHDDIRLGASPRAAVALYRCAQAWAMLAGRGFVLPDDVVAIAPAVLGHRLILDLDQQLRGATTDKVLDGLLRTVALPVAEAS